MSFKISNKRANIQNQLNNLQDVPRAEILLTIDDSANTSMGGLGFVANLPNINSNYEIVQPVKREVDNFKIIKGYQIENNQNIFPAEANCRTNAYHANASVRVCTETPVSDLQITLQLLKAPLDGSYEVFNQTTIHPPIIAGVQVADISIHDGFQSQCDNSVTWRITATAPSDFGKLIAKTHNPSGNIITKFSVFR